MKMFNCFGWKSTNMCGNLVFLSCSGSFQEHPGSFWSSKNCFCRKICRPNMFDPIFFEPNRWASLELQKYVVWVILEVIFVSGIFRDISWYVSPLSLIGVAGGIGIFTDIYLFRDRSPPRGSSIRRPPKGSKGVSEYLDQILSLSLQSRQGSRWALHVATYFAQNGFQK